MAKIAKWHLIFYGWSKKFWKKIFLPKKFLNGSIRKVIMLKVKFEDLQIFFPLWPPGLTLRKFSKHFLLKSSLNGTLKVIAIKVKFMDRIWNFITLKWKLKTLRSLLVVVSRSWDYCRSPTSYSSQLLVELYVENVG